MMHDLDYAQGTLCSFGIGKVSEFAECQRTQKYTARGLEGAFSIRFQVNVPQNYLFTFVRHLDGFLIVIFVLVFCPIYVLMLSLEFIHLVIFLPMLTYWTRQWAVQIYV